MIIILLSFCPLKNFANRLCRIISKSYKIIMPPFSVERGLKEISFRVFGAICGGKGKERP